MKRLTVMIKPASSLCDMRCTYCFYYDVAASRHRASMGIMTRETAAALIRNVYSELTAGDSISFAFQGGEPGLAGLDFFIFFAETAKNAAGRGVKTSYAFQTNGLMIDDAWCRFFKDNNVLVGLSLDGDSALHNHNRIDAHKKGTHSRVMEAKKLLDRHGVHYNVLCVLTSESARRARRLWGFILKEGIRYIQFIPCLEPLDTATQIDSISADDTAMQLNDKSVNGAAAQLNDASGAEMAMSIDDTPNTGTMAALTASRFYKFYADLFPLWKAEASKGNAISIRLFEDLAGIYLAGRGLTCGISGRCTPQIVVEADGSVYPCDFYVLDEYRVANLAESSIKDVFEAIVACGFLGQAQHVYARCGGCQYYKWCQGGCKRMAKAVYGDECGMKMFLDEYLKELLAVMSRA